MKNLLLSVVFLVSIFYVQAQTSEKELLKNTEKAVKTIADTTTNGWENKGNISLLFNQANFNNWIAGGESSLSGNIGINYEFNYKQDLVTWDNKLIGSYGMLRTKNSNFEKKTDDRFEFNSVYGKKAFGDWYYSLFLNFKTQFSAGYVYGKDSNGSETRVKNTELFSPAYLAFGPGLYWKKNDKVKVNFAPITSKLTFVNSKYTSGLGYIDGSYFGVDANKSIRYELGFYAAGYYKLNLMSNVNVENILSLYSNYLDKPGNVDIDYQINILMKVNRLLTANITFHAIYDDNAFQGFQTREVFGLGLNYGF
ncbi:DUF3078 domain-containing protein [Flavobacterium cellulosilyticum]|uniref:DUF3078 domain-containing protein n=1 Tax=Flavobacterium cellulosilyticum TaxID=2541731 RepID=A0A4R5CKL3_9FLAO|nr:DUF3078 domain-containing protein [Flavobacterium cellulosilyticum]TDD99736.1 DUF3078 domain-containing protein [Flavobacterium cellulosilyticum]